MVGVVGAGAGFRVVLHTKHRLAAMGHRSHGPIVEVQMSHFHGLSGQGSRIERKAMVLAGDFHLPGRAAGVIQTAVSKSELEGGAS